MTKKTKVYIYTRVSTAMQTEGYSLDAQRDKILDYAKRNDFVVVGEYSDAGFSGKNIAGRVQFQKMLNDIETQKDEVKYVVVFKLSRFGRNCADILASLQFMQDFGVNLICVEDHLDSSAGMGKLMISVMSAIAEIERENILEQTMSGRRQKAKEGGWNGGFAPYGYKLENGQLLIEEGEAEVVREIYNLYVNTAYGPTAIASEINKKYRKIPKGNGYLEKFTMNFVKDVLDNPVYSGKIAYGRHSTEKIIGKRNEYHIVKQADSDKIIIADGKHKAIVSEEMWDAAHQKRLANAKTKEKIDKEHEYLLSGLLRCPSCGGPMYGIHNGRKKKKDGTFYPMSYSYACRSSTQTGVECRKPQNYSEKKLVAAVASIIKTLINDKNFSKMVDVALNQQADLSKLQKERLNLQKEYDRLVILQTKLKKQLLNLDYGSESAKVKEEALAGMLDETCDKIAEIQKRADENEIKQGKVIEADRTKKSVYSVLQSFDALFDVMTDMDKKLLLKEMIDSIELYPRTNCSGQWIKTIHFKFPMQYNDAAEPSTDICFDSDGNFQPKGRKDESIVLLIRE